MAFRIRSLSPSVPVVVPLASGRALRLSPGQVSQELSEAEISGSAKVEKLRAQHVIEVEAVEEEAGEAVQARARPRRGNAADGVA